MATRIFAMMTAVDVRAVPAESRESTDHERARLAATIAASCTLAAAGAVVLSAAVLKLVAAVGFGP